MRSRRVRNPNKATTRVSTNRPDTYLRLPRTCQKSFANSSRYIHWAGCRHLRTGTRCRRSATLLPHRRKSARSSQCGLTQAPVLLRALCHRAISPRISISWLPSGDREYRVPPAERSTRRSFSSSRNARTHTLRSATARRPCRAGISLSVSESAIRIDAFHCPRMACIPTARSHH
ncbi:hypothetical protein CLV89_1083 [Tritonibacter scottomollicae]|uniref:Uncharacterized protein n=1 Tax=Tritonibacter scottomollicae TaxID=483013 RepID=A0A2T1AE38_TRISK|nr:hypothetical protein CLV89_1083 [Tritonibacter scottomollicae]